MTRMHTLKGSISTSCTFVGGESHRGDAYTKKENTFFFKKKLFCLCFKFCLCPSRILFLDAYISCILHCWVLDMHLSLYYCALLIACSDDHLLCYMIIVVIPIWLSYVWSSCLYVSQHVYLIAIYLLHYTCPFITWFTLRV